MLSKIRLATRQSALALWQARYVKQQLETAHQGLIVDIVGMTTQGDQNKTSPLSTMGGKGVFVKELELALLESRADIAVHSMKDVPAELPEGLAITAICEREDPRDAFVSRQFDSIDAMPAGTVIGSSSLRRRLQLRARRPELRYLELRGNVDTRLQKLSSGEYDAIILAVAGLKRLGREADITQALPVSLSIPAAGQGAVGIESRSADTEINDLLLAINDPPTFTCVSCEREISSGLGANCHLPIAAFARIIDENVELSAYVSDLEGERSIHVERRGVLRDSQRVAHAVVKELIDRGAGELLESRGS